MHYMKGSVEKIQQYFGITEQIKNDSAIFFIYIQPKLGKIYDESVRRGLGEHLNLHDIRDKHLSHLSTLLTGGIDHRFITESCLIWKIYNEKDITTAEYIRLYQLLMSYFTGEAHKKHWWRYKRYRNISRAVRNLLLFDLALSTGSNPEAKPISDINRTQSNKYISSLHIDLEEMTHSCQALQEAYTTLQDALDIINQLHHSSTITPDLSSAIKIVDKDASICAIQPPLFVMEEETLGFKKTTNQNQNLFFDILMQTHHKAQAAAKLLHSGVDQNKQKKDLLDQMLDEVNNNLRVISHQLLEVENIKIPNRLKHEKLYSLLQDSSHAIKKHLHHLEQINLKH